MFNISTLSLWASLPYLILFFFSLPIIIVLSSLLGDWSENWLHLFDYVLFDYTTTSIYLVLGVSFLVLIIGTITAWLICSYDLPGKRIFEWALILPLSIPP